MQYLLTQEELDELKQGGTVELKELERKTNQWVNAFAEFFLTHALPIERRHALRSTQDYIRQHPLPFN